MKKDKDWPLCNRAWEACLRKNGAVHPFHNAAFLGASLMRETGADPVLLNFYQGRK